MGDLPDMAARVAEARGANSPRPVDRAVQELDSALLQFLAFRVDVVDVEGEGDSAEIVFRAVEGVEPPPVELAGSGAPE